MAKNAENDIKYFLQIEKIYQDDLANIRLWQNLKMAFDEDKIWIKDFDYVQINSLEVKSIPYKTIFYEKSGKLFLQNSRLPERNVPSLLWASIERALPVRLPSFNHNYFGVNETININIIPSESEAEAVGMITKITNLSTYIQTAPAIRLQNLRWTILNNDKVFIIGKPLLPITGETFWQRKDFLLPTGYDFDLHILSDILANKLNPDKDSFVIWNKDNNYFLIHRNDFQNLSIGSFRESVNSF